MNKHGRRVDVTFKQQKGFAAFYPHTENAIAFFKLEQPPFYAFGVSATVPDRDQAAAFRALAKANLFCCHA